MERIYNKLVRDNIPNIIELKGETPVTRILNDDVYKIELEIFITFFYALIALSMIVAWQWVNLLVEVKKLLYKKWTTERKILDLNYR